MATNCFDEVCFRGRSGGVIIGIEVGDITIERKFDVHK